MHPTESDIDIDKLYILFDLNMSHEALNPKKTRDNIYKNAKNSLKLLHLVNELKAEVEDLKKKPLKDEVVMERADYIG